jgi:colanic acid/amylovoran biosynthesis glycosyltransferase
MEAMAAGLTVVSTYHSGIPELIDDHKTGFLVPERDVAALTGKLAWIAENPKPCEEIALAARKKIEAEFNSDLLNQHFVEIAMQLGETRSLA